MAIEIRVQSLLSQSTEIVATGQVKKIDSRDGSENASFCARVTTLDDTQTLVEFGTRMPDDQPSMKRLGESDLPIQDLTQPVALKPGDRLGFLLRGSAVSITQLSILKEIS